MEWKPVPIPTYEYVYMVSDMGDVLSLRTGQLLTPKVTKAGYLRVALSIEGVVKMVAVHRLVAKAFIPNPENKPTVNHKNENKMDNRAVNLEWATNAEQNVYGTRIERAVKHTDYKKRNINYKSVAEKHDYSKSNMCNRKPVKAWTVIDGKRIYAGTFPTQKAASEYTGVSKSKVSQCVKGKIKTSKGFMFEIYMEGDKG